MEVFTIIIYFISAQFFVTLLNIYLPLYPKGSVDSYPIGPAITLFCISFMWTSTIYTLGALIDTRYDLWNQAVQNAVFASGSELIY